MNTNHQTKGYFLTNKTALSLDFFSEHQTSADSGLREAQIGAYWAVMSHFTLGNTPAIVVLPTGAGKTALMTLLAFGLVQNRILIVAPNKVIREQIYEEFANLNVIHKAGVVQNHELAPPTIYEVKTQLSHEQDWLELTTYDVIVSTPKCISPSEKGVFDNPPINTFDTIFIDEAHHLPAKTWNALLTHFSNSMRLRTVLFTATPYRNDRQPIEGTLVYHYPIQRAIKAGFYRPIEPKPVVAYGAQEERDKYLADSAKRALNEYIEQNVQAKLIVRAGRLGDTERLKSLYDEIGIKLEIVTSERTLSQNRAAISNVRNNLIDGLIAVGMLGEGLDLPQLRIGVLHTPFQSFPITLQFIGRLCRVTDDPDQQPAQLLVIPEDVQQQIRELYELEDGWTQLIPALSDAAINDQFSRQIEDNLYEQQPVGQWPIPERNPLVPMSMVRPYFSVTAYESENLDDFFIDTSRLHLPSGVTLYQASVSSDNKRYIYILKSVHRPNWTDSRTLHETSFDLIIYYKGDGLLFEASTSSNLASKIRRCIGPAPVTRANRDLIEKVLSQNQYSSIYYTVGMRRTSTSSSLVPQYKTFSGHHSELAIRNSDGHLFARGHVFGEFQWNGERIPMGASWGNGTVWAAKRDYVDEFVAWCEWLATSMNEATTSSLNYLEDFRKSTRVTAISERPYHVDFNPAFYKHVQSDFYIDIFDANSQVVRVKSSEKIEFILDHDAWNEENPTICRLELSAGARHIHVEYTVEPEDETFKLLPSQECNRAYVHAPTRRSLYALSEYLCEYPPSIYLADGNTLIGNECYEYLPPTYSLPEEILLEEDWGKWQCDIKVEDASNPDTRARLEDAGTKSILETMPFLLKEWFPNNDDIVAYCDHQSGEIADFVALGKHGTDLQIHLFHCKASKERVPGARQDDAYTVLGQCLKSLRYFDDNLYPRMRTSIETSGTIVGNIDIFNNLVTGRYIRSAEKIVYAVQPGFDIQQIRAGRNTSISRLLLSVHDNLSAQGVNFRVIGSGS